jgi:O-acetyl-ADP-ribose deacetylase (regulator of RNase III)
MLQFQQGDLLHAPAQALVNTVNTVGIMGKGIALQFKEAFPSNYKVYADACKRNELAPGKLLAVEDHNLELGRKLIINFPTKTHWRQPSRYEYIEQGLAALKNLIKEKDIKSIAVPPLGCGNGGLDWDKVKPMITEYLGDLPANVIVYEPNAQVKAVLQQQASSKVSKLTPARALLMYALFHYESLGEYSSLFSANKLAWFLQRLGQPLRLDFKAHVYGPYAIGVEKVLYALNGVYLKGLEQQQAKPFEPLLLDYGKWEEVNNYIQTELQPEERTRLQSLINLLDGFQSELSLEILASVDYLLQQNPGYSLNDVITSVESWTSRKKKLFRKEYVTIAYDHLIKYRQIFT